MSGRLAFREGGGAGGGEGGAQGGAGGEAGGTAIRKLEVGRGYF